MVEGGHPDTGLDVVLEGDDVQLRIPPYSDYLRTVRLVAADSGRHAGLDLEEIEDFRIAVDELTHLLMTSTDHEITISFGVLGSCVAARGTARRRAGSASCELSDFARTIISSVSDYFHTSAEATQVAFSVMKQRSSLVAHP